MAASDFYSSGNGQPENWSAVLKHWLDSTKPKAVCIVSAYVTVAPVKRIQSWLTWNPEVRLLAGTDGQITHPEALKTAQDGGWEVRLHTPPAGKLHSKFIVCGAGFQNTEIVNPAGTVVGSANLTKLAFDVNVEANVISSQPEVLAKASQAFSDLWNASPALNASGLANYEAIYAEHWRLARAVQLLDSEAALVRVQAGSARALVEVEEGGEPSFSHQFANTAWATLESFTGDYTFQVEFPKTAGLVVERLVQGKSSNGKVDVLCSDGVVRHMKFVYYSQNGMFRLNVPNSTPSVAEARSLHQGVAVVSPGPFGGPPVRLQILLPGAEYDEIIGKALALGTWGKRKTQKHGWRFFGWL